MKHDDLQMMRNVADWPCFPFLPLKRRPEGGIGMPEIGLLAFTEGGMMFHKGMGLGFSMPGADLKGRLIEQPSTLIAEGWIVD